MVVKLILPVMVRQRVLGLALGYEDLNDHDQLRLWFSTFAYLILARLRGVALQGTVLARATVGTIRLRLLQVAAMITVSVRRVHVRLAGAFPLQDAFRLAHQQPMTSLQAPARTGKAQKRPENAGNILTAAKDHAENDGKPRISGARGHPS